MSTPVWTAGADVVFYAFALATVVAALATALRRDLRRAAASLLLAGAGLAGLFASLGAGAVAVLQGVVVVAGVAMLRRSAPPVSAGDDAGDGRAQPATPSQAAPADGDAGDGRTAPAAPAARWRAALLVIAFFVIASRAVLMTRWPVPAAAATARATSLLPAVSLPHYLVTALVLFCIGLFAAIVRRRAAGVAMGVHLMSGAGAVVVVAVSHFVGGAADGRPLAALVIVSGALPAMALALVDTGSGGNALHPHAAQRTASAISVALACITLALLAGSW